MSVIDRFMPLLMEKEEEGMVTPVLVHPEVTFVFIKHTNIYCKENFFAQIDSNLVVSSCRTNVNVTLVLSFLYKCIEVKRDR